MNGKDVLRNLLVDNREDVENVIFAIKVEGLG